ncbi:beta-ketoacyl synthase N-terminal-like domain-containing protein [Isosphaeraceae bacterium EP7]
MTAPHGFPNGEDRSVTYRPGNPPATGQRPRRKGVAIIGMSCLFPGAPDVDAYWRNILGKVDSVTAPPPEARETALYYEPNSAEPDRVYCQRGGYLGALSTFDPLAFGVPPVSVGGEPDQWLSLRLAREAMADAGCLDLPESVRRRTSVILGKGTYLNAGNAMAIQHGLVVSQTLEILGALHPEYTGAEIEAIRRELKRALPPIGPETVAGLIPNIIVGRIANRLDLMGPSYTVDAACASSLIAVQQAMRDLASGDCDLAIAGGSQIWIPMPTLSIFCQLGALSRRQQIRPFDKDADGTLLGEGIGMVVLKRIEDAERDGDRIYAVVRGVGVASDGRGMSVMAPRVQGEELALRRAYEEAGVSPDSVGLIEAHGTGTPVGDATEVQALTRVFGQRIGEIPRCAIGSVKSMISHTIPAAGVAGIIKVALSLYHKVLPPTLNCEAPNPRLELEKTPFYINTEARPWAHGGREPRRAGVNSFGFGGINAHAILEEHAPAGRVALQAGFEDDTRRAEARADHRPEWECEVCILGAESPAKLLAEARRLVAALDAVDSDEPIRIKDLAATLNRDLMTSGSSSPFRLAVVAASAADLKAKLGKAAKKLGSPGCLQIRDVSGIYYAAEPLGRSGKLAILFPGEGAQYPNMLADLCLHFPEVQACFDEIDQIYYDHPRGYVPSDHIFPRSSPIPSDGGGVAERLWQIAGAVEAVLTANRAMLTLMERLGLRPDVILGHSTGEYSAIRASGIFDPARDKFSELILTFFRNYEVASGPELSTAVLLAVGAGRREVEAVARETGGEIYVAMDNCPHQAVLVGEAGAAARAEEILRRDGLIFERLKFDRAYHTPLFIPYAAHLKQIFQDAPIVAPTTPIYSCTSVSPYPDDPAAIRKLMLDHWLEPVEFRRTVERLHDDGVRLFVEVGPRGNLTAFVEDILRDKTFCAIPSNVQRRSGIAQLNHLVAILTVHGIDLDLMALSRDRCTRRIDLDRIAAHPTPGRPSGEMKIRTGFPSMSLGTEAARRLRAVASGPMPGEMRSEIAVDDTIESGEAGDLEIERDEVDPEIQVVSDQAPRSERNSTPGELQETAPGVGSSAVGVGPGTSMVEDFLQTMERFLAVQERVMQSCLDPGAGAELRSADDARGQTIPLSDPSQGGEAPFALLGSVVAWTPEVELTARRTFDPLFDLALRDHTLGREISRHDPDLLALPVMPLTMSMEILAEAAAALMPGRTVTGLRDVRAHRWIDFGDGPQELQVTALRRPGFENRVDVQLRNLTEERLAGSRPLGPVVEASVVVSAAYPHPDPEMPPVSRPLNGKTSGLRPGRLYGESMFHGPTWQGVESLDEIGEDGAVATLRVLPLDALHGGAERGRFVLDPIALDAAGQVVGFWTAERLDSGKVVFPFHLESLEVFGPPRAAGESLVCVASIGLIGDQLVRTDIEIVTADGQPWMRLTGWEDKRFELPDGFEALMRPSHAEISEPWEGPIADLAPGMPVECRRLRAKFLSNHEFWKRIWAHRVLSRSEREDFRSLRTPLVRQLEWLAGRTAVKEAVRRLLLDHENLDVRLADLEIKPDERGRPMVLGAWADEVAEMPVISISHSDGLAVAIAALPDPGGDRPLRLGIDVEFIKPRPEGFLDVAFGGEELEMLRTRPHSERDEWAVRMWCAKEAVGKATGEGLGWSTRSTEVVGIDPDGGIVEVRLSGELTSRHPDLNAAAIAVRTISIDRLVVATTFGIPSHVDVAGERASIGS